jgi:chorismate synthase
LASNYIGNIFRVTTWGESHGKAIGAVIDGCPAGLALCEDDINKEMQLRKAASFPFTTPRKEPDVVEILSGVYEGMTTGAPISLIIYNSDVRSESYSPIQQILRPGHANYCYQTKYASFDHRGGGRASGRETACRVAAAAVAKKLLAHHGIILSSFILELGGIRCKEQAPLQDFQSSVGQLPCPDPAAQLLMKERLQKAQEEGDSLGAIIECRGYNIPKGLGDPTYHKLGAELSHALMSIPACKGIEIGDGFSLARMQGSLANDLYCLDENGDVTCSSNRAGGILAGISNGMPLVVRVAIKPTSSVKKPQASITIDKKETVLQLPEDSRHDPCIGIRAVAVVEAMVAIVVCDALLAQRLSRL